MPETEKHLEMMKDEDRWPVWPFLPLKRGEFSRGEVGILVAGMGPLVHMVNLFETANKLRDCQKAEYTSFEQLVSDGWVVD